MEMGEKNVAKVITGNILDPRGTGLPEEIAKPFIEALEGFPSSKGIPGEMQGLLFRGFSRLHSAVAISDKCP